MFCGAGVSVVPDHCHQSQTGLHRSSLPPTNKVIILQTLNLELDFSKLHLCYDCPPIQLPLFLEHQKYPYYLKAHISQQQCHYHLSQAS